MVPTWVDAKRPDALYVNLFAVSQIDLSAVGRISVERVQQNHKSALNTLPKMSVNAR